MTPAPDPTKQSLAAYREIALVVLLPLAFFAAAILPAEKYNDVDGFYHYRIAQLIAGGRPWVDIRWLPLTILGQDGPDHHWLFHVLIAPFTWVSDDILGFKMAIIVTAGLVTPALYWLMRKWQVPGAWLFALLALFGGFVVPWRFEMLRAQDLSLVLACFFVYFLVKQRHLAVMVLVWIFFNSYHGAAITVPITGCYLAWRWLAHRQASLPTLVVFPAAVALALVLNPWFPKDVEYILFHTLYKVPNHLGESVGAEWLAYPLKEFLIDNVLLHGIELILLLHTAQDILQKKLHVRKIPTETAVFVAMSLLMFFATLFSMRFIEYYVPFSAISSGLLWRDLALRRLSDPSGAGASLLQKNRHRAAAGAISLLLLICAGRNLLHTGTQQAFDVAAYRPLAEYLENNVPKGSLIFNSAWSDFPLLLWHTRDYPMVIGLDPHYLAYSDPQRFALWSKVTQLHQFEFPGMARSVAASFNTRWILVHTADHDLAQYLVDSRQAALRFTYQYGWLFEVEGR